MNTVEKRVPDSLTLRLLQLDAALLLQVTGKLP
jgi:hypothetical protein